MTPPPFTRWVESTGLKLTPGQKALWRTLGDGLDPVDDEMGRTIFGGVFTASESARKCIVLRKGARIGGTMLCAYRLLYMALTVRLDGLAPGERASAPIVGPDVRLAKQALTYVVGLVDQLGIETRTRGVEAITIVRPDGREVAIETLPATAGGRAVRGRSLAGALFTEFAFFKDENYSVNDAELHRAVLPRILPGGQLLCESTPFAESGMLYALDKENFGAPKSAIVAHAATSLMRPELREFVESHRALDPTNVAREFDGEFMSAGSGLFFSPQAINACVDPALVIPSPPQGVAYAGADWAFERDASALVVADATKDAAYQTSVTIRYVEELQPTKDRPLRTDQVVACFAAVVKTYKATSIMADAHYRRAIVEHLEKAALSLEDAPGGQQGKTEAHIRMRDLVNAGRVKLPAHPKLIEQLKAIISKPVPGGGLHISTPRKGRGGHGDTASACILAVFHATGGLTGEVDYAGAMRGLPGGVF